MKLGFNALVNQQKMLLAKCNHIKLVNKLVEFGYYFCFPLSDGKKKTHFHRKMTFDIGHAPGEMLFKPETTAKLPPMAFWKHELVYASAPTSTSSSTSTVSSSALPLD